MSDVVRDPSGHRKGPIPIFDRGDIVFLRADCDSKGKPNRKLWVWYVPSYEKTRAEREVDRPMLYLLKDGPGGKANDVCWADEANLFDWMPPKEEESLIDLA